jgi:4-phytase/acid phosphatase
VAPGELTPHGAAAVTLMGEGLRQHYSRAGLLSAASCAKGNAVYVWADSSDNRTRESGEALAKGLDCGARSEHGKPGDSDIMFDAVEANVCPVDPLKAQKEVSARLPGLLARNRAAYQRAREKMQSILTPSYKGGACTGTGKDCRIAGGENRITDKGKLEGPLDPGSTLSEVMLLEYAQGMPNPGWGGAATPADLAAVMPLHEIYADLMRRTPYLASRRGSHLVQEILDLLAGKPGSVRGAPPVPKEASLVVFLGHDTNLSNLSGLLDANWRLPGQPDATAPDTALAFEVWKEADGRRSVKLRLFYQTPDQLRGLAAFTQARPVPTLPLSFPGCSAKEACTLDRFQERLSASLAKDCLAGR